MNLEMRNEDAKRLIGLLKDAQIHPRSKEEITSTFEAAGIIDENGDLKGPYKGIYITV